jgi:uncharacterized protein (TIGR02300 family)
MARTICLPSLHINRGIALASDERGTKRTCPVTGRKFYDLNQDPVVSPYTGKSYPLSFFEAPPEKPSTKSPVKEAKVAEKVVEDDDDTDIDPAAAAAGAEVISLNDAEDDDDDDSDDDIPDVEDVEVDDELGGDDDDTFLESDDDDDDDIGIEVDVDDDER